MGQSREQYWTFKLWIDPDSSAIRAFLDGMEAQKPSVPRLIKRKIKSLQQKPPGVLEKSGILQDFQNGLWGLEVSAAGQTLLFIGVIEHSSWGMNFTAIDVYVAQDDTFSTEVSAMSLLLLSVYKENNSFKFNHHGLQ